MRFREVRENPERRFLNPAEYAISQKFKNLASKTTVARLSGSNSDPDQNDAAMAAFNRVMAEADALEARKNLRDEINALPDVDDPDRELREEINALPDVAED